MLGEVEVMDTTQNVYGLAGRLQYTDTLSQIHMTRDPAIMSISECGFADRGNMRWKKISSLSRSYQPSSAESMLSCSQASVA